MEKEGSKHISKLNNGQMKNENTYTSKEITTFIGEEISLQPNSLVTIWNTPDGLKYTRGSMEYREQGYDAILLFRTMDDVPEGEELENSVEFQMNK